MIGLLEDAVPEVDCADIDGWSEDDRSIESMHIALVKLDPAVASMTFNTFCESVIDAGEDTGFAELVEVYDRDGDRNSVFRVTGDRVPNAPRYFLDNTNAALMMHGAVSRDNVATALYEPESFADSVHHHIDSYRLFTPESRENRSDEIRHANSIIDRLHESVVEDGLEDVESKSPGEFDDYFAEYLDDGSDEGSSDPPPDFDGMF